MATGAIALDDYVIDNGMNALFSADKIYLCSSDPANYTAVLSAALGVKDYGAPNLAFTTIGDWQRGRQISLNAITNGVGSANGTANYYAAVSSSRAQLLAKGLISAKTITNGGTWSLQKFTLQQSNDEGEPIGNRSAAGVFDSTGKLVRTLWSAEVNDGRVDNPLIVSHAQYVADPRGAWDGKLDDGTIAPSGTYTIKVITHNIKYSWDGVIGNTTPTAEHTWKKYYINPGCAPLSMAVNPYTGEIYYTGGYHEKYGTLHYMQPGDINHQYMIQGSYPNYIDAQSRAHLVCTDGVNGYQWDYISYGGYAQCWDCATKALVLPGSLPAPINDTSAAGKRYCTSMAVQQTGAYIFLCYPGLDFISVCNKTTPFTFVQDYAGLSAPWQCCTNPANNDLWVGYSSAPIGTDPTPYDSIVKCTVDSAGNITPTSVVITGFQMVLAMAISPDGSTLLVADGGSSQQVKAYNTSNGSVKTAWATNGVLGQAGGYATDVHVTDNKFLFQQIGGFVHGTVNSFIAFVADGSFWLGDNGNYRCLHFTVGNSPIVSERFMAMPSCYSSFVCRGDSTRVFGSHLEFKIDYSKPLDAGNGSWTLVKNYAYAFTKEGGNFYFNPQSVMGNLTKMPNGRCYCCHWYYIPGDGNPHASFYEITDAGWRKCKTQAPLYQNINWQGDLFQVDGVAADSAVAHVYVNKLTGFDADGDPIYTTPIGTGIPYYNWAKPFPSIERLPTNFPGTRYQFFDCTANGIWPTYAATSFQAIATNNHFGGIDLNGKVKFNTCPASSNGYVSGTDKLHHMEGIESYVMLDMCEPPFFSRGGGGSDSYGMGVVCYEAGRTDFFTGQRCELWAGGQNNWWLHWHESGLCIGQFGTVGGIYCIAYRTSPWPLYKTAEDNWSTASPTDDSASIGASNVYKGFPGHSGNTDGGGIAYWGNDAFIYHHDEWIHGGIHRWRIAGLDTIHISDTQVNWDSTSYVAPVPDPNNFLAKLPYAARNLQVNAPEWNVSDADYGSVRSDTTAVYTQTNTLINDPHNPPDLLFLPKMTGPFNAWHAIPRTKTDDWWFDLVVSSLGKGYAIGPRLQQWGWAFMCIEILDTSDKIMLRLSLNSRDYMQGADLGGSALWANDAVPVIGGRQPIAVSFPFTQSGWGTATPFTIYISYPHIMLINADVSANTFTVTYGRWTQPNIPLLDATANIAAPAKFRVRQYQSTIGDQGATFNGTGTGVGLNLHRCIFNEV
jgi:hypothetical protein